jgi:uncharacterized protein YciI
MMITSLHKTNHATALLALMFSATLYAQSAQPTQATPVTPATTTLYVVHFTTGPAWDATKLPNEQQGMREHSANLARLRNEGKLITGARYKDSQADKGMIVLRAASIADVEAMLARDPMVAEKRFTADIAEFRPFYAGYVTSSRAPRIDTTKPLSKFAWMVGCWETQAGAATGAAITREHWMAEAGGMMLGMSRMLREGRVLNHEAIRIELDSDGVPVYVPKPSGQAEARFRLQSDAEGKLVFENLKHDFPQRIIYQPTAEGGMLARIEGERNGKLRAVDFPMRRASCE